MSNRNINLYIIFDASGSMRKTARYPALREVMEKLNYELANSTRGYIDNISQITSFNCSEGKVIVYNEKNWLPDESKLSGAALILDALEKINDEYINKNQLDAHLIIIISDGLWCARKTDITSFEDQFYQKNNRSIISVSVSDTKSNLLTSPLSLNLKATDIDLINVINNVIVQLIN